MYYFDTPNYSVALNAKVGSSSLARAIIRQFHPMKEWMIQTGEYPPGADPEQRQWQWLCPGSEEPSKPVVLLVRDPLDRFLSACQQVGIHQGDVASAIASLVDDVALVRVKPSDMTDEAWDRVQGRVAEGEERRKTDAAHRARLGLDPTPAGRRPSHLRDNVHFLHQHKYAVGPTTLFKFPDHMPEAAAFLGITEPLPEVNSAKRQKPTLTPQQRAAVRQYYSDDVSLFSRIGRPGIEYTPPS